MKILAIRLKNLASIEGTFEIDFTAEPLASAGIFAISGATGSGKSTILDALCLALYDRTPRFSARENESSNVKDAGGNSVNQSDVRNILRRGTGEGFAEVTFKAVDGHYYTSRWTVKRAYTKAVGSLQKQTLQVKDVYTGEELQGKKAELLGQLVQLTGLTYDQFTRTVLLAQNDFATFLKSKEKVKAELLEKLTGTELYSKISEDIFRRSKEADENRKILKAQMDGIEVLSDEQYELLCRARNSATIKQEAIAEELRTVREKLEWYKLLEEFKKGIVQAKAACKLVEEKIAEVAPRLERLAKVELAEDARLLVNLVKSTVEALDNLTKNEISLLKSKSLLLEEQQKANTFFKQKEAEMATFRDRKKEMEEKVASARVLATELVLRKQEEVSSRKELDLFMEEQKNENDIYHHIRQQLQRTLQQIASSLNIVLPETIGPKAYQEIIDQLKKRLDEIHVQISTLQQRNGLKQKQLETYKINALVEKEELFILRMQEAENAKVRFNQWVRVKAQLTAVQETIKKLKTEEERIQEEQTGIQPELLFLSTAVNEVRRRYESAKFAVSEGTSTIRKKLNPDEACPVCGSTSHPYLLGEHQVDAFYQEVEREYMEAQKKYEVTDRRLITLQAERAGVKQQLIEKHKELQVLLEEEKVNCPEKEEERTAIYYETVLLAIGVELDRVRKQKYAYHKLLEEWQVTDQEVKKLQQENEGLITHSHQSLLQVEQVKTAKTRFDQIQKNCLRQEEIFMGIEKSIREMEKKKSDLLNGKEIEQVLKELKDEEEELVIALELSRNKIAEQTLRISGIEGELKQLQALKKNTLEQEDYSRKELREWIVRYNIQHNERLDEETLLELLAYPAEQIIRDKEERQRLNENKVAAETMLSDREAQLTGHQTNGQPDPETESLSILEQLMPELEQRYVLAEKECTELQQQLFRHEKNKEQVATIAVEYHQREQIYAKWAKLNDLFGSASGDKFKIIAQSYTLRVLLLHANKHLEYLTTRYRLQQVPDTLTLQVIDRDMCDEVRTVYSLSGGESFLVSLALALGLSSLSSSNLSVESLFIDEGFGSLDADSLRIAMDALEQLRMQGRKIGVISHVQEMRERIATQVMLVKTANGRSRIIIK